MKQIINSVSFTQGWTCDMKEVQPMTTVNQDIIDKACGLTSGKTLLTPLFSSRSLCNSTSLNPLTMTIGALSATETVCHLSALLKHFSFYIALAIRAIRNYSKRITSYSQARSIRGVGEKTAQKVSISSITFGCPSEPLV